jgi:hypothetical protein
MKPSGLVFPAQPTLGERRCKGHSSKLLPLPTPKPFSKNKNYVKTTYYHRNITRHVGGFSGV